MAAINSFIKGLNLWEGSVYIVIHWQTVLLYHMNISKLQPFDKKKRPLFYTVNIYQYFVKALDSVVNIS